MKFEEIPGLTDLKNTLLRSYHHKHVAHAQLFLGPTGSATLTSALAWATYIQCTAKTETDACGKCPSCVQISKFAHPDIHFHIPLPSYGKDEEEKRAIHHKEWRDFLHKHPYGNIETWTQFASFEKKTPTLSVKESRRLLQNLALKPYQSPYKIYIIWHVESLNDEASNALLKSLEEPPPQTLFFLIANDPEQLLKTIQSRTQMVFVRAFEEEEVIQFLKRSPEFGDRNLEQIAAIANGDLQLATQLIEGETDDNFELFRDWMRLCFSRNLPELVKWSLEHANMTRDQIKSMLSYGTRLLRNAMLHRTGAHPLARLNETENQFAKGFSQVLIEEKYEWMYQLLNDAHYNIERNVSPKMVLIELSLHFALGMKSNP